MPTQILYLIILPQPRFINASLNFTSCRGNYYARFNIIMVQSRCTKCIDMKRFKNKTAASYLTGSVAETAETEIFVLVANAAERQSLLAPRPARSVPSPPRAPTVVCQLQYGGVRGRGGTCGARLASLYCFGCVHHCCIPSNCNR